MKRLLPILILLLLPALASAQSFRSERVTVRYLPLSETTFEVFDGISTGPPVMWCAAAEIALRRYGRARGDIWLAEGLGPSETRPGRRSLVFSLVPVPGEYKSLTLSIRTPGQVVSQGLAESICSRGFFRVRIREVN